MELHLILIALAIGLTTGFINTLAGSGSLVTLPFLLFLGLPADVANGTNRVSILVAALVGTVTLQKETQMSLKGAWHYVLPAVLGAIGGVLLAVNIQPEVMETVIGIVIGIMLIPLLLNPKKWLREVQEPTNPKLKPYLIAFFVVTGFYGGFVQAGSGLFYLSVFVLLANYTLPRANVLKNLIIFAYSLPVLIIFAYHGDVDWLVGGIMAAGQATGAWIAGRFAGRSKKAAVWIHRLLVVMVVASVLKLFGVFEWLIGLF